MSGLDYAKSMDWPYPVSYGKENEENADVLVLGGGIAGCHAAMSAAKKGAKVVLVDKGPVKRSGLGGAGVDHWHMACTNPCSKITPEEMMALTKEFHHHYFYLEFGNGITHYITCRESWDALQDVEKMGVKVRDVDNEFVGAEFRDEDTKLMFAYDYENKHSIRVNGGADVKVAMHKELNRLGIKIYDRVMATSLLTEGGKQGARVIGATGMNARTGEFYVFQAKAVILATAYPGNMWIFSTELAGSAGLTEPNITGEGTVMAWEAGAELTMMERSGPGFSSGGFFYPIYGNGNAHNSWYACNIVDANGKEIPWVDRDGNVLENVTDRNQPASGQKLFIFSPEGFINYAICGPSITPDLPERIKNGEFVLPLYADLPGMPKHERRAIFGLMVANEGKGSIIYSNYTEAGFDPDKDMLQVPVLPPEEYIYSPWHPSGPRQWRSEGFCAGGGLVFDWDLKTNLEGLYVAGQSTSAGGSHATAATTGRYAGRKAAAEALSSSQLPIERKQVDDEKVRVYAPVKRGDGVGWKELRAGVCRIMQDYCGEYKNKETLEMGLKWLKSIKESEASRAYARNPHELARTLENLARITVGEIIIHASLNRKASSAPLFFNRLDYPEMDPPEWNKLVVMRLENNAIDVHDLPIDYWLKPPYGPTYRENYEKHCDL